MTSIVFPGHSYDTLARDLLSQLPLEAAGALLCVRVDSGSGTRLIVSERVNAVPEDYQIHAPTDAQLRPEFVARVVARARADDLSVVFVHTHPGRSLPQFSIVDDVGEIALAEFVQRRVPNVSEHAALVISEGGCRARMLGQGSLARVLQVGTSMIFLSDASEPSPQRNEFDRQVRAFGREGQQRIAEVRVGIVGLGGTGSIVAQELAHLGVHSFTLIDPDIVDTTNLNRLAGGAFSDVGRPKVEVARDLINRTSRFAHVLAFQDDVSRARIALRLAEECDFIFCCTDSHGSRAVLNQLAYQYIIPCIDMGVVIATRKSQISHITGRVQLLSPGEACLACTNLLDPDAIRRDLMTDTERSADPYFIGQGEPQPAVMSINGTVASLAVTMFLSAVAGIPGRARCQLYDAIAGTVRAVTAKPNPVCVACSRFGALGRGSKWRLPARYQ